MAGKQFEYKEAGLSFSVPEKPSVLEVLAYDSARVDFAKSPAYVVMWECAKTWIKDWKCEKMPDPNVDLNTVSDPIVWKIIKEVGLDVSGHRVAQEQISKK
jgi:hypothetical protein